MSSWKGKTRGGLLGYQIFIFLIRRLGLGAAYLLLRFVAMYYVLFAPKSTAGIYKYFRIIKMGWPKAMLSVYKSYYVFGQTLIDKVAIGAGGASKYSYTYDGIEHLRSLKDTGGIVVGAHFGNWEIAGILLNDLNLTTNILIYEAEHEKIKNFLDKVMKSKHVNVIPIKSDLSHLFKINNALRNKEVICVHGDRFMDGARILQKKFLGNKAFFPLGPFSMLTKLRVPYTFAYAVRGKGRVYHLSATPIQEVTTSDEQILDDYIQHLETKVLNYPLQWFNYYDFWSKDVKGASVES
ncbi:LpxL/LpxP family acyltransferase [Fulvivirga sediminis]|uniref:Lipid A biosynthesis acyltransferase n=1 Tax=Fulvivirga sediminis TaxID=2803949 RepID=A0A937F896_9BACT|nr:lipid A biosynthesis acyltransferase [Fulvivirga sediminis]MBL3656842.1 lipid A biosynthesis acyltransferase [Fulvivirga sediminis]